MDIQNISKKEIEMIIETRDFLIGQLEKLKEDFEDFPNETLIRHRDYMNSRVNNCLKAIKGTQSTKVIDIKTA